MNELVEAESAPRRDADWRYHVQPKRHFYAVLAERDLTRAPVQVVVFGVPYVLYRDQSGQARAHLDRCPHRNVALSGGRCRDDDTLECPYHGWRFRPDGSCALIPGSIQDPRRTHRVQTHATQIRYGLVWICPDPRGPIRPLPRLDGFGATHYSTLVRHVSFPAGLHAVVENALDVPHTSVLHRGLFRSGSRHRVRVITRRYDEWAEAEYVGEPPPTGVVARLLSLGKRGELTVRHWDRFVAPNLLQVEYRLGDAFHLLVSGFCTPVSPQKTELFAVASMKTPYYGWLQRLMLALIEPLAMRVYRQDVEILLQQRQNVELFGGERYMSTELDVLGHAITRLLKEAAERDAQAHGHDSTYQDSTNQDSTYQDSTNQDSTYQDSTHPDSGQQHSGQEPREVMETELEA